MTDLQKSSHHPTLCNPCTGRSIINRQVISLRYANYISWQLRLLDTLVRSSPTGCCAPSSDSNGLPVYRCCFWQGRAFRHPSAAVSTSGPGWYVVYWGSYSACAKRAINYRAEKYSLTGIHVPSRDSIYFLSPFLVSCLSYFAVFPEFKWLQITERKWCCGKFGDKKANCLPSHLTHTEYYRPIKQASMMIKSTGKACVATVP